MFGKISLLFPIAICIIFSLITITTAQGNNNIQAESDDFIVKVTGNQNVPKYQFWSKANESSTYNVFFHQLFEAENYQNTFRRISQTNIALPSLSWSFSEVTNVNGYTNFNITSTMGGKNPKNQRFSELRFINWLIPSSSSSSSNSTQGASLKFDVEIDGYKFVSDNGSLALIFRMTSSGSDEEGSLEIEGDNFTYRVGEAKFGAVSEASNMQGDNFPVHVVTDGEDDEDNASNKVWLVYDHFEGNLHHDPSMSVGSSSSSSSSSFSSESSDGTKSMVSFAVVLMVIIVLL